MVTLKLFLLETRIIDVAVVWLFSICIHYFYLARLVLHGALEALPTPATERVDLLYVYVQQVLGRLPSFLDRLAH